ncbi:MAG TPA: SRPBCC family protein [Fimbriimonas sp.]
MRDTIEREIIIRAPVERVYNAIAEPEQIVRWFPDAIEGRLKPGERPTLDFGEYGKSSIYVEAAEPHHYFAYRWRPGSDSLDTGGDVLQQPNTLVEFRLEPVAEGTRLKLTESGFASLPAEVYEKAFKDNNEGWDYMLDRLAKYAAQA